LTIFGLAKTGYHLQGKLFAVLINRYRFDSPDGPLAISIFRQSPTNFHVSAHLSAADFRAGHPEGEDAIFHLALTRNLIGVIAMKDGRLVVLLTGANGFVGRNLAPVLEANGMVVRRAARRPSPQPKTIVIDAIGPRTDWSEALFEVDAVVHLAARVHHPREEHASEIYRTINTDGTLHLARCAAKAGVGQFIYLSTILVNGASTDGRSPFREEDPVTPRGVYGLSKAAAEAGLEAMAKDSDMCITVIRPPLIYGTGAIGNFRLLVTAVKRGIPLPFGSIHNRRAFLGVGNLASFVVYRLTHQQGKFDIFLVADDEQVSTPEFVRRIAKALGKKSLIPPFPLFALKALFRISGRSEATDSVSGSLEVDTSKATKTGWRPPFSLDEGLRSILHTSRSS
jgi:UDP-glucose 4-epimerase